MRAGELHDQIIVKRFLNAEETTQDAYGRDETLAESIGTFWARITPMVGRELAQAQQRWADARFKVELEFQPGITFRAKDEIEWGARTLNILDIQDVREAREYSGITILAKEVV